MRRNGFTLNNQSMPPAPRFRHRTHWLRRRSAYALLAWIVGGSNQLVWAQPANSDLIVHKASASALAWPEEFPPLARTWQPRHKMVNQQNPPDFAWPAIEGATGYDLRVTRDAEGAQISRRADGLKSNFHNFEATFEPGVYFWQVRFRTAEGESAWSDARRFRIRPDAWAFPVPPIAELIDRIPRDHPRVWTTRQTVEAFRARAQEEKREWFEALLTRVLAELDTPFQREPVNPWPREDSKTPDYRAAQEEVRWAGWDGPQGATTRLLRTAFCYLVTQDERLGRSAIEQILNLATWDPNGSTSYRGHDQVHRAIAQYSAMAYDWCEPLMTDQEREIVLNLVRTRTQTMVDHLLRRRPISEMPFDSHGWSAFGFVGTIAIATLHDLPEARGWLEQLLPAYLNVMPPWAGEEGGWAQGVSYWQYSQRYNRAIPDILLPATGFNFYEKAFFRNHAYFPVYAFPHGSPRSHLGDGNGNVPRIHNANHLERAAQLYQDPVLQWAFQALGEPEFDQHEDYLGGQLERYFSGDRQLTATPPPEGLPKAWWFQDTGWVTMHSDLADPERVSLYFKSSPYGSYNHSHADQNGFVLYAFGEALAIDAGYYDGYGSPHDAGFTRQTLAHNAITRDGGFGQPIFDITARGRIEGFATHAAFDATTGDATAAYQGEVGRALRHVIYLRPDAFVVIDDLVAKEGQRSSFEWWLQALRTLEVDDDQQGATIHQGNAQLRVRFHAPNSLRAQVQTEFIGPPNVYAAGETPTPLIPQPQRLSDQETANQVRACFSAPAGEATRFVATLQPTRAGVEAKRIRSRRLDQVLELSFADGATVWVALTDDVVSLPDGLHFRGAALARVGEAFLLVHGDRLSDQGRVLLEASHRVTATLDQTGAGFSCTDDVEITVRAPGVSAVRYLGDLRHRSEGRQILPATNDAAWPVVSATSETLRFNLEPGWYPFTWTPAADVR